MSDISILSCSPPYNLALVWFFVSSKLRPHNGPLESHHPHFKTTDIKVQEKNMAAFFCHGAPASSSSSTLSLSRNQQPTRSFVMNMTNGKRSNRIGLRMVKCSSGIGIGDFIGGDLVKPDLGKWLSDVEEHKAIAIYAPHEGGCEGRYLNRLRYQGYYFLDLSARGLGDPETTLTKIHPVCPAHVGKQPIARWYFPPEVDYRLEALPPSAKGLVVWVIEAKVLSKAELQFLALLPELRPKVRVIAECGNWRKFMWKPLKEIAGLATE